MGNGLRTYAGAKGEGSLGRAGRMGQNHKGGGRPTEPERKGAPREGALLQPPASPRGPGSPHSGNTPRGSLCPWTPHGWWSHSPGGRHGVAPHQHSGVGGDLRAVHTPTRHGLATADVRSRPREHGLWRFRRRKRRQRGTRALTSSHSSPPNSAHARPREPSRGRQCAYTRSFPFFAVT